MPKIRTTLEHLFGQITHTAHGAVTFDGQGHAEVTQEQHDMLAGLDGFETDDPRFVKAPAPGEPLPALAIGPSPLLAEIQDLRRDVDALKQTVGHVLDVLEQLKVKDEPAKTGKAGKATE